MRSSTLPGIPCSARWENLLGADPLMLEAAILQLGLGEYLEAGIVAFLLVFNAALGFVQRTGTGHPGRAHRGSRCSRSFVRRDGHWTTVPAATLVPGDLVKLSLGSVVAADVRLISGSTLLDQSMLTGDRFRSRPPPVPKPTQAPLSGVAKQRRWSRQRAFTRNSKDRGAVRDANAESSEQKAILRVVRNLALFNGAVTVLLAGYAMFLPIRGPDITSLVLVAVLSAIPVALPSMFTLAAAVGARALALKASFRPGYPPWMKPPASMSCARTRPNPTARNEPGGGGGASHARLRR